MFGEEIERRGGGGFESHEGAVRMGIATQPIASPPPESRRGGVASERRTIGFCLVFC